MNIYAFLLLLATSSAVSAQAYDLSCPNISGTYFAENDQIRFDQVDCEFLTRNSAAREGRDGMNEYAVIRRFKLDGTPFLFDGKRGESVKLINDTYEFTFNFPGGHRYVAAHGFCEVPKMTVVKSDRNLKVYFQVKNCEDGFSGESSANWIRLSN